MIIATTIAQVRAQVAAWKKEGLTVGLVPTMGYLHEGHASLVDEAVRQCDRVVASDFVNPTQFGPNEDLEAYPRDFDRDCALLEEHGCAMVFHPAVEEMYAPGAATYVEILSDMPKQLCGKTRPIHFRGVCTVVSKLFNIVTPDKAFFGQKDAQQLAIIRQMVRDLSYGIEIVGCPIVREADGLAKSSRNTYLSEEERKAALVLSKAVFLGEKLVREGETDADRIVSEMKACIEAEKLAKIDYVSAVDAVTMESVHRIDRPVSGAVLFAKTSKALTRLNEMIREGRIRKVYWALTERTPDPESGELRHYILRDARTNRSRACDGPKPGAKEARLRYETLGAGTDYTLVEVELLTGRHHQIRAQLSKIGCPIRGDLKYGARRSLPGGGISLHSRRVEFEHPVRREPVSVTAPAPEDDNLWAYFETR